MATCTAACSSESAMAGFVGQSTALSAAWPEKKQRLCIFIHGLVCNEHCWEAGPEAIDMPRHLEADTEYTALTLRYNSGLPIVENGAQLALWLEELLAAWPYSIKEVIIIGHSMGGLLARSAFEQSKTGDFNWPALTRMKSPGRRPN